MFNSPEFSAPLMTAPTYHPAHQPAQFAIDQRHKPRQFPPVSGEQPLVKPHPSNFDPRIRSSTGRPGSASSPSHLERHPTCPTVQRKQVETNVRPDSYLWEENIRHGAQLVEGQQSHNSTMLNLRPYSANASSEFRYRTSSSPHTLSPPLSLTRREAPSSQESHRRPHLHGPSPFPLPRTQEYPPRPGSQSSSSPSHALAHPPLPKPGVPLKRVRSPPSGDFGPRHHTTEPGFAHSYHRQLTTSSSTSLRSSPRTHTVGYPSVHVPHHHATNYGPPPLPLPPSAPPPSTYTPHTPSSNSEYRRISHVPSRSLGDNRSPPPFILPLPKRSSTATAPMPVRFRQSSSISPQVSSTASFSSPFGYRDALPWMSESDECLSVRDESPLTKKRSRGLGAGSLAEDGWPSKSSLGHDARSEEMERAGKVLVSGEKAELREFRLPGLNSCLNEADEGDLLWV